MSKRFFSRIPTKKSRVFLSVSAIIIPSLLLFAFLISNHPEDTISPEVGFTSVSPAGTQGGIIVPASCPSDLHDDPWYGTACQQCNACGNCANGTYQCSGTPEYGVWHNPSNVMWVWWGERFVNTFGESWSNYGISNPLGFPGACSVGTPALPPGYGGACSSAANNCGSVNPGTVGCGGCSAVAPPANIPLGAACNGPANACGMTLPGTVTCTGCSAAVAPNNNLCTLAVCKNSCASTLDRTGNFTVPAGPPNTTLKACFYNSLTNACSGGVDITGSATWTETDTPKDAIYFSPTGVLNARYVNGDEVFNVSYLGITKSPQVTVVCIPTNTCNSTAVKAIRDTYCPEVTQDTGIADGCGQNLICSGRRKCNYNWREASP